jgi:hypothetical protein
MIDDERVQELETSLSDDERALLDDLADGIARRRLTAAALFFLESVKPFGFISSQVMVFFRPMIEIVWANPQRYDLVIQILSRRGALELLLRRLEARS